MRRLLVTGGAGFIGSHFVKRVGDDDAVVVVDKLDYCASLENIKGTGVPFIKGDVRNSELISKVLRDYDIDHVIHFAAQTHVDNSFGNSLTFTRNNVEGTHALLEVCKTYGKLKKFIHVSTDEVYGNSSHDQEGSNTEHGTILQPTNPYAATKAAAEMLVMAYGRSYGLPCVITRGNNVYGPNQYPEKVIPKFIGLAMCGEKLTVHGDGLGKRSYLHIDDAVSAFHVILKNGKIGEIYNIGTSEERTTLSVAKDICEMFHLDPKEHITHVQDRPFNDRRYFIDSTKLHELGWSPEKTWSRGLKETIDWYKACDPTVYWKPAPVFLIYGKNGWIGGLLGDILKKEGYAHHYAEDRLEHAEKDIERVRPTHILNAAGITGRPNVDWCENHRKEVIQTNVSATLHMIDVAKRAGVHVTNFATGCIYTYDDEHPVGSGKGFTEDDPPNFRGSYYSRTKCMVEELIKEYDNVWQLRLRMPISSDLNNPRNFVYKIARYEKIVNIPNSMTVLDELLPLAVQGAIRGLTGVYNFTNPGVISHNEVMDMYGRPYTNFTEEEQNKILAAPRSNNHLDTTKLQSAFPKILDIKSSLTKYVFNRN
jgi:UDP-glucose 4,6-dehydratase